MNVIFMNDMTDITYQEPLQMVLEGGFPSVHAQYQHRHGELGSISDEALTSIPAGRSAPMKALHALVSHQVDHQIAAEQNMKKQECKEDGLGDIEEKYEGDNESNMIKVSKDADLSPKLLTKGRKYKLIGDSRCTVPTRLQAKRIVKASFK